MADLSMKRIDDELYEKSSNISFLNINPINAGEEKEKFFCSKTYNPQFKYREYNKCMDEVRKSLESLRIVDGALAVLFEQKRKELIRKIDMARAVGTSRLTECSKELYGWPDRKIVSRARRMMNVKPEEDEDQHLKTKQVISYLKFTFLKYGFNWKIREKDMPAEAAVITSSRTLYIRKNARFSKKFLQRLVVHEVGTHILRAENGRMQPYKIFARGLANYLTTEEGLAVYNQELHGLSNKAVLKKYAGRTLAVDRALKGSFRQTYNYLRKSFSKESAWNLTLRAKRGLKDTSKKGAFTKDYLYLKGYFEIKDYVRKGKDIELLYYGKVGLNDLDYIKRVKGMIHPKQLRAYQYFQYFADLTSKAVGFHISLITAPLKPSIEKAYHPLKRGISRVVEHSMRLLDSSFENLSTINKNNKKVATFFGLL